MGSRKTKKVTITIDATVCSDKESFGETIERIACEPREIWLERVYRIFGNPSRHIGKDTTKISSHLKLITDKDKEVKSISN